MRPDLRLAAAGAALISLSQPALAQGTTCIAPADLADAVTYVMPLAIESAQSTCSETLPADSFLLSEGAEFANRFEPLSDMTWPGARRLFMNFAERGKQSETMSGILDELSDDELRPFLDAILVQVVASEITPASCSDINTVLPLLAPLPPENYGPLLVTLFGFIGDEENDLKICKD